jgi:hypothetical protein
LTGFSRDVENGAYPAVEFLQLVIGVWPRRDPHFLEKLEGHQLKVVRRARLGERRLTRCWSSSNGALLVRPLGRSVTRKEKSKIIAPFTT